MKHIKETIIVEGRYDANMLHQCVDAHIVETSGFGIFNNTEKRKLIEMLAEKNGIIVLTDSDGAGFVIRNHLNSIVGKAKIKHAYIPEIAGKEKRKTSASKAGLLGVEGMKPEIIIEALRRAGATFEDEIPRKNAGITKQEMFELGLSGGVNSAEKREKLARMMNLPSLMSANAFLSAINMIYSKEEFFLAVEKLED